MKFWMTFEIAELKYVLSKTKYNFAYNDRIPYEHYKNGSDSLLELINNKFNRIYEWRKIPKSFQISILLHLFEKGVAHIIGNYRGITFNVFISKLFNNLFTKRM